jgi:hypothetical protein
VLFPISCDIPHKHLSVCLSFYLSVSLLVCLSLQLASFSLSLLERYDPLTPSCVECMERELDWRGFSKCKPVFINQLLVGGSTDTLYLIPLLRGFRWSSLMKSKRGKEKREWPSFIFFPLFQFFSAEKNVFFSSLRQCMNLFIFSPKNLQKLRKYGEKLAFLTKNTTIYAQKIKL